MSLIIKGLDMPKLDENEEHLWVPGWIEVGKDGKAIFCTGTHFDPNTIHSYAVEEVPTPHGRLIDADKLLKSIDIMREQRCKTCSSRIDTKHCDRNGCWMIFISDFIGSLPTIIEAEVSE